MGLRNISYSFASVPEVDDYIEFHIKHIEGGVFSTWLRQELSLGDTLYLQGPIGDCFYTEKDKMKTLFLSGVGTGLAPLYGIIRDALKQGHEGDIHLLLGAKDPSGFYFLEELEKLQRNHTNVHVRLFYKDPPGEALSIGSLAIEQEDIYDATKRVMPNFSGVKVFLCGADSFVNKMKKQCFLSGASMKDIAADSFVASGGSF